MTHVFEFLFWLGCVWLGYVYLGYPALLWFFGLFRSFHLDSSNSYQPKVSVLISARNERKDIGWKIAETLAWDYPREQLELLVASDASEDGTDEILANVSDPRFRALRLEERKGKNEALNRLNELARGELLFFTDANSHIDAVCLRKMVRHFADSHVGCVTGIERTLRDKEEAAVATGTRASLGYESLVNALESRIGSVLVADGSIFCMRRSLFSTMQRDLANDFELPAHIGEAGYAILFDPLVVSFEKSTSSPTEEFNRRRRICAQGILGFWRLRHCFRGLRAWQLFSRKFLRWFGVVPLTLILLSNLWLVQHTFYALALALQAIFYNLAFMGWLFATRRRQSSSVATFPFFFVLVNIAALVGVVQALSGKRFGVWESAAHSRGSRKEIPVEGGNRPLAEPILEGQTLSSSRYAYTELRPKKH
jgi:cellulose synthase/poly-beta-1,6-N-acetylglucosamine synthase-like glycosyltransferase